MRRVVALAAARFVLLLAFASPAFAQFLSPGEISAPHREIAGDGDCDRCHSEDQGVTDRLCLDCHRPIAVRLQRGAGYHGKAAKSEACTKCHPEHLGRSGAIVRWPGGRPEAFNHLQAGWALTGKHHDAKCRDCHVAKYRTEGNLPDQTWLGLPTACQACHKTDDPHKGQFRDRACTQCHVTEDWKTLTPFDHAKTKFALRGKHADVKCAECHEKGVYSGTSMACVECHETPHPKATEFGEKCERCHTERLWSELVYAKREHRKFPLDGGHAAPKCTDCHGPKAVRAPVTECVACHARDDVHKGQFGRKCESCHQISAWKQLKKGAAIDHDKTAFPLRGEHIGVECAECHPNGRFKPIAHARCLDCHRDPHEGKVGTQCEDCHAVGGFQPALYPLARHTTFALTGAHRAVPCNDCHRPAPPKLDFRQGLKACAECHRDPHGGQFAPRTCEACHTTAAWVGAPFDHAVWPLTGRHARAACVACHDGGRYEGTPRTCVACHGDTHLGQFVAGPPVKACDVCHRTEAWKGTFDHMSVWPLEGEHEKATCAACHKEVRVSDGRVTVRWRLGFQDCARCHENVHRRGPTTEGQP
jgi:hypothetical protein